MKGKFDSPSLKGDMGLGAGAKLPGKGSGGKSGQIDSPSLKGNKGVTMHKGSPKAKAPRD